MIMWTDTVKQGPYEEAGWPMPADGDIERCISSGNWEADHSRDVFGKFPYSEKTSFSLPVSAENLYFLSHGQNSHGDLAILTSDQDDDAVRVEVVVRYYTKGALERATVCQFKRGHDEHGFGIFVSSCSIVTLSSSDHPHIDTTGMA